MTENVSGSEFDTNSEVLSEAYKVGIEVAMSASRLALRYWPNKTNPHFEPSLDLDVEGKDYGIGNYVTAADKGSERLIIDAIQANSLLAHHRIISEESDPISTESVWQWVIDPIDGSLPFKNGLPEFGISIGLLNGQDPMMGIIAMPALGQIVASQKGKGARLLSLEGETLSDLQDIPVPPLNQMLVGYDLGYSDRGNQLQEIVAKLSDRIGYPVSYGSAAAANFRLALGHLGAYFFKTPAVFDIGAPASIIAERGGIVTDMSGDPIDWQAPSTSYLASANHEVHQQILEIINEGK